LANFSPPELRYISRAEVPVKDLHDWGFVENADGTTTVECNSK
jgi:hypothetical protein